MAQRPLLLLTMTLDSATMSMILVDSQLLASLPLLFAQLFSSLQYDLAAYHAEIGILDHMGNTSLCGMSCTS